MILVSYDISNDRLRGEFSKVIKKYGRRIQYSVYEINNSERYLNNILIELSRFEKKFSNTDSVLIIKAGLHAEIKRFGYAKNEESDIIVFN